MALVPYLAWLGVGAVALATTWALTRRVPSPSARLALRCLAAAVEDRGWHGVSTC